MRIEQILLGSKAKSNVSKDLHFKFHHYIESMGLFLEIEKGLFAYSPLGWKLQNNIIKVITQSMESIGFTPMEVPILQNKILWENTGRKEAYGLETFISDDYYLAPTAEDMFFHLIKKYVTSSKEFPLKLFQISQKFRNEKGVRNSILRTKEFYMKDGYSWSLCPQENEQCYREIKEQYLKIFRTLSIPIKCMQADTGPVGGKISEEFIFMYKPLNNVQDDYKELELGHIFNYEQLYSKKINLKYNGIYPYGGCYGLGLYRIMASIIEVNYNYKEGEILWPKSIVPYDIHIIIKDDSQIPMEQLDQYNKFYILDHRKSVHMGEKINLAYMMGAGHLFIINGPTIEYINRRNNNKRQIINWKELIAIIQSIIKDLQE